MNAIFVPQRTRKLMSHQFIQVGGFEGQETRSHLFFAFMSLCCSRQRKTDHAWLVSEIQMQNSKKCSRVEIRPFQEWNWQPFFNSAKIFKWNEIALAFHWNSDRLQKECLLFFCLNSSIFKCLFFCCSIQNVNSTYSLIFIQVVT